MNAFTREVEVAQPKNFTEAPFMHERDGTYYLSCSYGKWDIDEYSVHYSTGPQPFGPWTHRGIILSISDKAKGPGHHSFVTDPESEKQLVVYHKSQAKGRGPYRG